MKILIIDDEAELRSTIADILREAGHDVVEAGDDARAAETLIDQGQFDLAISDVRMPEVDGISLLRRSRSMAPSSDFILMTAYGEIAQAVSALKDGAADYLTKPFDMDDLLGQIARIENERQARGDLAQAKRSLAEKPPRNRLIGQSPQMLRVQSRVEMIAQSEAAVLIEGESGTGKELVARLLHDRSARAGKPFVAVNCGAFPETLIEAELFGFERGAFTGAVKKRDGRFKAADGGTLFLDEIAELPLSAQAKLLRVLQEGAFEPIGTNTSVKVDFRLVSATHRNLRKRISEGLFREDLFYRINVLDVTLPPLREREGDVSLLIQYFLDTFAIAETNGQRRLPRISSEAVAALTRYPYPGNVRELAHAIEHAVVLAGSAEIGLDHLPAAIVQGGAQATASRDPSSDIPPVVPPGTVRLADAVKAFEKAHLQRVLAAAGGKRLRAAEMLGISRKSLWEKLREHEPTDPAARARGGNAT